MRRTLAVPIILPFLAILTAVPVSASNDFGVTIEFYRDAHKQAELMAAAGVRWVRIDLAWSAAEPEPGRYEFRTWDRFLDSFEPLGIRTLFILDYGNRLYEDGFPPSTESGRAAFAAFAGAAARHFRGRAAWEIWNEPNLPQFWAGSPDPAAYVALARAAAAEIRREDRRAWILGPSLGGGTFDFKYLDATFALGLLDIVDAVSVHPYGAAYPEAAAAFYDDVRRRIARHAPDRDIPVVVSEWGYAVEGLGREEQAQYLLRALETNRRSGIPLTIWYNWQEPITPWHSFGLLDVRGRPKPAYLALASIGLREQGHEGRQGQDTARRRPRDPAERARTRNAQGGGGTVRGREAADYVFPSEKIGITGIDEIVSAFDRPPRSVFAPPALGETTQLSAATFCIFRIYGFAGRRPPGC